MASIFKRNDVWWVSYYQNGIHKRRSLKTTNRRIAEREKQAIEAKILDTHIVAPKQQNPTIEEFWKQYVEYAEVHLRPNTIKIQTLYWGIVIKFTKAKYLSDINFENLNDLKFWMKKRGNSEQTINNVLKDVRAIFNKAIKFGWYTGDEPTKNVERFKIPRKMPEFHTQNELEYLLEEAKKHSLVITWVVLLGGWAGFRKSEISCARWDWFNFDDINPTINIKAFPGFKLKDNEDRSLPMHTKIKEALLPHRKNDGFLFSDENGFKMNSQYRFACRMSPYGV